MKRIVSVSRRTDIPAFYGDWFMGRLKDGFVGVVNPFSGQKDFVSLKRQDVVCFVFWSKNFRPFLENLRIIDRLGYKFYFNYTVTGLPAVFETNVEKQAAIETLKQLSRMYSPRHINWRFDPIIISSMCDRDFYIKAFEKLVSQFEGFVERCYFSFVAEYNKVKRNFQELERAKSVRIVHCSEDFKIELANELAAIARRYGIEMFSCCGDYLVSEKIKKAHCIDGSIIESLFFPDGLQYNEKPTRSGCGCTESIDIGTYDTCPQGCVYCYANANPALIVRQRKLVSPRGFKPSGSLQLVRGRAYKAFRNHDKESAFLGHSRTESDRWLAARYSMLDARWTNDESRGTGPEQWILSC